MGKDFLMKKVAVILVVSILIVALIFTAYKVRKNNENEIRIDIKIDGDLNTVQGGEVNTFRVETNPSRPGKILFPSGICPYINDRLYTISELEFSYTPFSFDAFVPPVENINITVIAEGQEVIIDFNVTNGSNPMVSGEYWYELERDVTDDINGYNGRYIGGGSPQLERAAEFFRGTFEEFGLEARTERYITSAPYYLSNVYILNVLGYHWGENRNEWIVIGGHFDVAPPPSGIGAWQGAYDNTAGTCAVVSLAKGISQLKTNKTIVFALWSGEEEGLHGSRKFVENIPNDVTVKSYINLDMVGLAYPSEGKKCYGWVFPNETEEIENPDLIASINVSIFDVLRYPRDKEIFDVYEGGSSGSDHTSFYREGIPSVFFLSGPVSYYHDPRDTLDNMIIDAGGLDMLIAGFNTILWISFYTTIHLDNDYSEEVEIVDN